MARIPEAEIERLKEAVPVARLVEASGVELKVGGKDLLGRCPFHEDATASLVVTPGQNLWHCFGWLVAPSPPPTSATLGATATASRGSSPGTATAASRT